MMYSLSTPFGALQDSWNFFRVILRGCGRLTADSQKRKCGNREKGGLFDRSSFRSVFREPESY